MSYRNTVVNGPKKGGKKKSAKKAGKKRTGKKRRAKKAKKAKAPKAAKKPRAKKKRRTKKGRAKKAKKPAVTAPPIGASAAAPATKASAHASAGIARKATRSRPVPQIRGPRKTRKPASRIKVDAQTMSKLTKGVPAPEAGALEQARRAGTGEAALSRLSRAARRAARKSAGKAAAPKRAKKAAGGSRAARGGGRRGMVPGDLPIRAGAVPARRKAAKKGKCRPGSKPPVRCQARPSASSAAACSTANARWNKQREADGTPKKSTKRACGPGVPGKKASARMLGYRKAAKVGPKTKGTRPVRKVTEAEQRRIMSAFMRSK